MKKVPLIGNAYKLIDEGCIPGAAFRNLEYAETDTLFAPDLDYNLKMLAYDAQTSGGLLISAPHDLEKKIIAELKAAGLEESSVIGHVTEPAGKLVHLDN
jgi:selenide,water dikinase